MSLHSSAAARPDGCAGAPQRNECGLSLASEPSPSASVPATPFNSSSTPVGPMLEFDEEFWSGTCRLTIHMARKLPAMDHVKWMRRTDPHCQVVVGAYRAQRTRSIRHSLHPKWEETFDVDVVGEVKSISLLVSLRHCQPSSLSALANPVDPSILTICYRYLSPPQTQHTLSLFAKSLSSLLNEGKLVHPNLNPAPPTPPYLESTTKTAKQT